MSQIMTVCGPISPGELGFTLPHEHVFTDLTAFPGGTTIGGLDAIIDPIRHKDIMVSELQAFKARGGQSILDLTPRNAGGDVRAVKEVSEATGLNIIVGCGWYRDSYMESSLHHRPTRELAEELVGEIEQGIDGTDIRPGIIGEIGTNHYHLTALEERCLRAEAMAARETGLALTTHLPKAGVAFEVLDIVAEYDIPPDRVVIGHADIYQDADYHARIMDRGAYVEYDNIRSANNVPLGELDALVAELVGRGYANRILLSHDICWRSHLHHYGGDGFDYIARAFIPQLKEKGVSDEAIQTMTVENPRHVLTV